MALVSSAPTKKGFRPYLSISFPKMGLKMNSDTAPLAVSRASVELAMAGSPMMFAIITGRDARVVQNAKTDRKVAGPRIERGLGGFSEALLWAAISPVCLLGCLLFATSLHSR
jgi:hypothetical protein